MSIQFSDASNYRGIIQMLEKELGFNRGDISGNSNKLKDFTADINFALDDFFALALTASGKWQLDDSNQTDYPIIKANLVSAQRDYIFTTDGTGNLILDIYKVAILPSATATLYEEIKPIDQQSESGAEDLVAEQTSGGVPYQYDKTANGIFLDPRPNYNATNGLKVYINREASYFVSTDTTKKPGVPGLFHAYFYFKPALEYARRNNLTNWQRLKERVEEFEGDEARRITGSIQKHFGKREKDVRQIMTPKLSTHGGTLYGRPI